MESYEVRHDGNTFEVMNSVSDGGMLTGIQVFPDVGSILITMETNLEEGSELRIVLPRALIDATEQGNDSQFLVIVDGEDTEYEETRATDTAREILIPLPEGTSEVEIFGTQVVPEFPVAFGIMSIIFAAIIAAGVLGKSRPFR